MLVGGGRLQPDLVQEEQAAGQAVLLQRLHQPRRVRLPGRGPRSLSPRSPGHAHG